MLEQKGPQSRKDSEKHWWAQESYKLEQAIEWLDQYKGHDNSMQKQELWFKPSGSIVRLYKSAMHYKWKPNNWFIQVSTKCHCYWMKLKYKNY